MDSLLFAAGMDLLLTHGGALLPVPKIWRSGRATTLGTGPLNAPVCVLCRRVSHRSLLFAAPSSSPWSLVRSISAVSSSARWVVDMEEPPAEVGSSRADVVDYYVGVLARILGDENEAQSCIYDASWQNLYRFRCEIDEEARSVLAGFSNVLSIRPDKGVESDQFAPKISSLGSDLEHWQVRMKKPGVEVVTKAQIADYYTETLMKVLGNEKDAQVSIYHISWERDFGFCCQVDEECARGLADLPEVHSVLRDKNIDSKIKVYGGDDMPKISESSERPANAEIPAIKTKRLFVAGLSFYTSEKTLREAFEGFGDLVEVKIIIDKISKRSKGYAFIEYATEEAASMAMKEMNGKIINGWMIVVDVAKSGSSKKGDGARWAPP